MSERAVEEMPRRHRLTAREYRRMGETGLLAPDERVELIEGLIIDMPPIGSRHAGTVNQLAKLLQRAIGDRAILQIQNPVSLDQYSEPEPDLAITRPRADFYKSAHPQPPDILLIIEVSDATLSYDHDTKLPLYARHAIPEVWIVDLESRKILRYREPREGVYSLADEPDVRRPIELASVGGLRLNVGDLFSA